MTLVPRPRLLTKSMWVGGVLCIRITMNLNKRLMNLIKSGHTYVNL